MKLINPSAANTLSENIDLVLSSNQTDEYSVEVSNHSALKFIKNPKKISALNKLYKFFKKEDLKNDRMVDMTDRVSGRFGNTAGGIRWRKGHLLKNKKVHAEILAKLKPLDMITEKTYFALTDKFIPGYFGHNAIWLGTKEELIELGLWNHNSIIPFQKEIEAGKSILEVDRSGTHLKSLEVFINIDEFAFLRLKEINFTTARLEEIYQHCDFLFLDRCTFNFIDTDHKIPNSKSPFNFFVKKSRKIRCVVNNKIF
jgi:hypothetical protein